MNPSVRAVTDALIAARRDHVAAVAAPFATALQDAGDAYAVQAQVASSLRFNATGMPRHWKSGGPSRTATLTHAPLPDAGVWGSPGDARAWPLHHRLLEAELALRLGHDFDAAAAAALTHEAAAAAVDAFAVSIELVDFRWAEDNATPPLLKLADQQAHSALVLGSWQPFAPRDWSRQRCVVRVGGAQHTFTGTHSLQDPAWLLPLWLRHATRDGAVVPAGTVVTTGTWCGLLAAKAGDLVVASFDGIGSAEVQL